MQHCMALFEIYSLISHFQLFLWKEKSVCCFGKNVVRLLKTDDLAVYRGTIFTRQSRRFLSFWIHARDNYTKYNSLKRLRYRLNKQTTLSKKSPKQGQFFYSVCLPHFNLIKRLISNPTTQQCFFWNYFYLSKTISKVVFQLRGTNSIDVITFH